MSNMALSRAYQNHICLFFLLGFIMGVSYGKITKNKMCVLFEYDNHVDNFTTAIGSIAGTTKSHCFSSCVRDNSCSAFHFRPKDGNCELLKTPEKCMSDDVTMGTLFIQLTMCDEKPPWKVVSPALHKLQWKKQHYIGYREVVRTQNRERGILLVLSIKAYTYLDSSLITWKKPRWRTWKVIDTRAPHLIKF